MLAEGGYKQKKNCVPEYTVSNMDGFWFWMN